jgi:Secretion system C-terminal sorting domain
VSVQPILSDDQEFYVVYPNPPLKKNQTMRFLFVIVFAVVVNTLQGQNCYSIGNRLNGNGLSNTCGTPDCSGNAKTGHIDINFGASCPGTLPSLQLISVTSGGMPNPFCFDPGNCISPGVVRYCFRGTNLPTSGFMVIRLTMGATIWSCTYDAQNLGGGTLLPVQFSFFKARLVQKNVKLEWRTEMELNNESFTVERSRDGNSWETIGVVKGHGSTLAASDYQYTDFSPGTIIQYYRIRQNDIGGHSSYTQICRIDNRLPGLQFNSIYPNPAHGQVKLVLDADHKALLKAKIFDISGRLVRETERVVLPGQHTWQIDLPGLLPGLYKMVITGDQEGRISEKLIVI